MSDTHFILLLKLSITLHCACAQFTVRTFLQYPLNDGNSVSVICLHNVTNTWTLGAIVLADGRNVCEVVEDKIQSETSCTVSEEKNLYKFTMTNLTDEEKKMQYQCEIYRKRPFPIKNVKGEKIKLVQGIRIDSPNPTNSCKYLDVDTSILTDETFTLSGPLSWALIGAVHLFCFYSMLITVLYIRLRTRKTEELNMTYVRMQENCINLKKKVKQHSADKNAEYMDMRLVQQLARPSRDMNHNSHPHSLGLAV